MLEKFEQNSKDSQEIALSETEKLSEQGKNPGLGIKELHSLGIDGRGIKVAIIDQKLLTNHKEYVDALVDYAEYGELQNDGPSMHGPAVASLLVGRECGTAPGAELVYKAVPEGRNFALSAKALMDIIDSNKTVEPAKRIRIISCSIGYIEEKAEPGLDKWIKAIKSAKDAGIIFIDTGDDSGLDFIGGGSLDKENVEDYDFALFMKERHKPSWTPKGIIVPSDYRTMASWEGEDKYRYEDKGGMSWSAPYLAGVYAMALEIDPNLTQEQLNKLVLNTAIENEKGLKIINPKGIIESIKQYG